MWPDDECHGWNHDNSTGFLQHNGTLKVYVTGLLWGEFTGGLYSVEISSMGCPICILWGEGPGRFWAQHYCDAIMGTVASQITSLTIVYTTVYSDADQRKHQSSASPAFVWGEFPAQRASYAENVSIWWRHHDPVSCGWMWLTSFVG